MGVQDYLGQSNWWRYVALSASTVLKILNAPADGSGSPPPGCRIVVEGYHARLSGGSATLRFDVGAGSGTGSSGSQDIIDSFGAADYVVTPTKIAGPLDAGLEIDCAASAAGSLLIWGLYVATESAGWDKYTGDADT